MKKAILIALLFLCQVALCQRSTTKTPRSLNLGFSAGIGSNFSSQSNVVAGQKALAMPLLSGPLNYFSLSAQLGSKANPKFGLSVETGFQTLRTAYGPEVSTISNGWRIEGYEMSFLFLKPGMFYNLALSPKLSLVPKIHLSGNLNVDYAHTVDYYGMRYAAKPFFMTIDPSVELRANIAKAWLAGVFIEYQQGLSPAVEMHVLNEQDQKVEFSTYNGSGLTFGLRLSYCIPCKED